MFTWRCTCQMSHTIVEGQGDSLEKKVRNEIELYGVSCYGMNAEDLPAVLGDDEFVNFFSTVIKGLMFWDDLSEEIAFKKAFHQDFDMQLADFLAKKDIYECSDKLSLEDQIFTTENQASVKQDNSLSGPDPLFIFIR